MKCEASVSQLVPIFLGAHHPLLLFFPSGPFRDCLEAQEAGHGTSGMFIIKPDEAERPMQVWCEQEIDNGGWTVFQTRRDGSVNFFRNWDNYKVMTLCQPWLSYSPLSSSESLAHLETTKVLLCGPSRGTIWDLLDYILGQRPSVFT